MKLIKEYGMKKYEAIVKEANEIVQYKTNDYLELKKFYANKIEDLPSGI